MRVSLKTKTITLFVLMMIVPTIASTLLIRDRSYRSLTAHERMYQLTVLSNIRQHIQGVTSKLTIDTTTFATLVEQSALDPTISEKALTESVRAVVSSNKDILSMRFQIPLGKDVLRVHFKQSEQPTDPPPELVKLADKGEIAVGLAGPAETLIAIKKVSLKSGGPVGYVLVNAKLELDVSLEEIAAKYGSKNMSFLVATRDGREVGSFGVQGDRWKQLPLIRRESAQLDHGIVHEFVEGGVQMVGASEALNEVPWDILIWRPRSEAFDVLSDVERVSLLVTIAAIVLAIVIGLLAATGVTRPVLAIVERVRRVGQRRWREIGEASPRGDEIGELDRSITEMARDLEKGEKEAKLRGDLSRFMSAAVVDAIVKGEHALALGGKRAEVSVLFADVVGFTPLTEARNPEQMVALLNELFSVLSEVVFRHGGTVDKFIGDCIMAVWGAPVATPDHAERALAAAEDMMRFLETANDGFRDKYDLEIRLGIGVSSGEAIVGNIGSDKRMEYTVVGDIVNVAARLESIAQPNQVLVAERTQALAGDGFELKELGARRLTGRQAETKVYELVV